MVKTPETATLKNNSRRRFVLGSVLMSGAWVTGIANAAALKRATSAPAFGLQEKDIDAGLRVNVWLRISPDGTVWLAMPRAEMGQGIHTAMSMLVAEELGCTLGAIRLEDPDIEKAFANQTALAETVPFLPSDEGFVANTARSVMRSMARLLEFQLTGGSTTMADAWVSVRIVAAATRMRLEATAATRWNVPAEKVRLLDGIVQGPDGQRLPMQALVPDVMQTPTPNDVRFADPARYRYIGSNPPRVDLKSKVTGSAAFGSDVRLPGQVTAVARFCPTLGGTVRQIKNLAELKARPGVIDVVTLPALGTSGGIAVVAQGYWTAYQASLAADIEWNEGRMVNLNSARVLKNLTESLESGPVHWTYRKQGDSHWAQDNTAENKPSVSRRYTVPYLAHATMEPMNATAWLNNGAMEVWAPTQAPGPARNRCAQAAGMSAKDVRIHTTYLGGGFGRRIETDFLAQAVHLASLLPGRPVQLIWPREQDMQQDYYRPTAAARLSAKVSKTGKITHWAHRTASGSVGHQVYVRSGLVGAGPDKGTVEGGYDTPYTATHLRVDHVLKDDGVPLGYWRSVGHSYQGFFVESFVDELAHEAAQDPYLFRMNNLPENGRHAKVLKAACEKAGYGKPLPAGRAHGLAVHESFGSVVAQVLEVSVQQGNIKVHKVVCAVDCGLVIHPDGVKQQMESGVAFAMSAALYGQIDIENGRVKQSNFTDYPVLKLAEMPKVEVVVLPSGNEPSGVGEIAVPPLAAALANGVFKLTGQRLRSLPLRLNAPAITIP